MENRRVPYYGNYQQPRNNKNNTTIVLVVIISILLAIIIAGGAFYFFSMHDEVAQLKKEQAALNEKNERLAEENQQLSEQNVRQEERISARQQANQQCQQQQSNNASYNGNGRKVVIDGNGVRLRFSPSLNAGFLTWPNGATRSVKKGTRLQYTGETDGWYQVSYLGNTFYVSKDFSYIEN